jgi:hypothetical protein
MAPDWRASAQPEKRANTFPQADWTDRGEHKEIRRADEGAVTQPLPTIAALTVDGGPKSVAYCTKLSAGGYQAVFGSGCGGEILEKAHSSPPVQRRRHARSWRGQHPMVLPRNQYETAGTEPTPARGNRAVAACVADDVVVGDPTCYNGAKPKLASFQSASRWAVRFAARHILHSGDRDRDGLRRLWHDGGLWSFSSSVVIVAMLAACAQRNWSAL